MVSGRRMAIVLTIVLLLTAGCGKASENSRVPAQEAAETTEEVSEKTEPETSASETAVSEASAPEKEATEVTAPETAASETAEPDTADEEAVTKNGEVMILFTSDIHCGVDRGFGFGGLSMIRDRLEREGYTTILVDDGDAIQGEAIGTISKGEAIINLMNDVGYDIAIPGNHDFDYGIERLLELADKADFTYISCNFNREGEGIFAPYVIRDVCDMRIAFVGVTTPETMTSSTPTYFQNDRGEYIYGFMQDETGEKLYTAVQSAVDAARAEGVDYVYVLGHLGNEKECEPWTYADVISHTRGIDVFLDGHSHDSDTVVMKNMDGEEVTRCAVGTKLSEIGYSRVTKEEGVVETDKWSWPNDTCAVEFFEIDNDVTRKVDEAKAAFQEKLNEVVAKTSVDLTIYDPVAKDDDDKPIRIVRRMETNLGDLCADALRDQSGADVAIINGGAVRTGIKKGDITYDEIINVFPFGNELCVVEVTGQQILDALEWGSRSAPSELGGFLQVSGISYEIDTTVNSGAISDENSMFKGIGGQRRVKNVLVDGEAIDPAGKYTLASIGYLLLRNGDGYTMFDKAPLLQDCVKLDNLVLIDYITDTLGGVIGDEYADPYGQGRITITE